jgi:hypothetical protein
MLRLPDFFKTGVVEVWLLSLPGFFKTGLSKYDRNAQYYVMLTKCQLSC